MSFWNKWESPQARIEATNDTTGRALRAGKRDTNSQESTFPCKGMDRGLDQPQHIFLLCELKNLKQSQFTAFGLKRRLASRIAVFHL